MALRQETADAVTVLIDVKAIGGQESMLEAKLGNVVVVALSESIL